MLGFVSSNCTHIKRNSRWLIRSIVLSVGVLTLQVFSAESLLAEDPPVVVVPDAAAATEAEMKPYKEIIVDSDVTIEMLPIKSGKFMMGSPESEANREEDEGPQHEVEISPFLDGQSRKSLGMLMTFGCRI
jgi:hypothetical protein